MSIRTVKALTSIFVLLGILGTAANYVYSKVHEIDDAPTRAQFNEHVDFVRRYIAFDSTHNAWQDSVLRDLLAESKIEVEKNRALNCWIANNPIGFCDDKIRAIQSNLRGRRSP